MDVVKVFFPSTLAFFIGVAMTPSLTHFLYKYKLWKKVARKDDKNLPPSEEISSAFKQIHNVEEETRTPRPGGMIVWVSILITTLVVFIISKFLPMISSIEKRVSSLNVIFVS